MPACFATEDLQKLTEEEKYLVHAREDLNVDFLCGEHHKISLSKYEWLHQKHCSNPFRVHTKKVTTRLSTVTIEMFKHDQSFVPGKSICKHCKTRVKKDEYWPFGAQMSPFLGPQECHIGPLRGQSA